MSKNKNNKQAPKEEKKAPAAKTTTKVEEKKTTKAEEKAKEAPAEDTQKQEVKKPKTAPKAPPAFKPADKQAAGDTMVKTLVDSTVNNHYAHTADARVTLLDLADRRFSRPDAQERLSPEFLMNINMIIDAGVAAELADEAMYGDGTFARVMQSSMLPQFRAVAAQIGITLPETKALEALTPATELEKGNIVIATDKANISKETQKQIKKEHELKEEVPELDPKKVFELGEEALKKALQYKLICKKGAGEMLVNIVDFMREYRMEEAHHAENTAEAMLKFDNRTVGEWLDDAFQIITPTILFRGIGTGMCATTGLENSPVHAFVILKNAIKKGNGDDVWDDQSIASATTAIIRWIANDRIEANKKDLALLDKKAENYKELAEKYEKVIAHQEGIIAAASNPSYEFVESITEENPENVTEVIKGARKFLTLAVYPNLKPGMYKNLNANLQQYAGYVTGLFREAGTADANYQLSNMTELELFTEEESKEQKEEETKKD